MEIHFEKTWWTGSFFVADVQSNYDPGCVPIAGIHEFVEDKRNLYAELFDEECPA